MSAASATTTSPAPGRLRLRASSGWFAAALAAALVTGLWLVGSGEREVQRSAVGFAGLVEWLDGNDVDARIFRGHGPLVEGTVGLRVLPLHDSDLTRTSLPAETPEALIAQTSENDIDAGVVAEKLTLLPTLVILPKWRSGVRVLGAAHRDLLIPPAALPPLPGLTAQDPGGYSETATPGGKIGLFHAQTLSGSGCEPLLGTAERLLLGRCALADAAGHPDRPAHFWLLADPDLMNNHGLGLAGNAAVALDFVRQAAAGGPVVLDLTDYVATVPADWEPASDRSWEEFARLFAWPFSVVWVVFGALAGLVLWRALVRDGPVVAVEDEERMRASREISIDAKARLLRLADHDAALLGMHFATRLHQLGAELAGPHIPAGGDPLALVTRLVGRRAPELARALAEAARPPQAHARGGEGLIRRLDEFETLMTRIRDEFGRAPGARG